jgi:hypothetical protein
MKRINSHDVGRVAATAIISMGLTVGAISVASAASHSTHDTASDSVNATAATSGTVTALSSTSITVLNKGVSSTFTIATTTTVLGSKHMTTVPTLALGQSVVVRALTSAPTVATQITIEALKPVAKLIGSFAVQGHVTVVSSTSVTVVNAKGVTSTFAISTTTKILGGSHKSPLAVGQRVVVRALKSAPTAATRITIER